jgi:predicted RNA-binding Zn-ribbon protein involved in translation (DUF1610 family)
MTADTTEPTCDECGSRFVADRSATAGLCAECAHRLYGYPPCAHVFADGRCAHCGWDGSVSAFLRGGT